jgi:hypothetical protein
MSKKFHITQLLSVYTGILFQTPGTEYPIEGVYEILDYMTGEELQTVALPRASKKAKPYLERQFPWLASLNYKSEYTNEELDIIIKAQKTFTNNQINQHGEWFDVISMFEGDHEVLDPYEDIYRIDPTKRPEDIITLDLSNNDNDDINPIGDLNWKVDNE